MTPRTAIFLNQRSGSAPEREALAQELKRAGIEADIHGLPHADLSRWVTQIANGYETLVAAGGDGTASMVASVAMQTRKRFGVIPSGTLNHFARDLGIPASAERAIAVLADQSTTLLDVAVVNDRPFLNNASIGAYPRMVWERNSARERGLPRPIASALAIFDTWWELGNITARLGIDRLELVRRSPFVVVGNGAYELDGLQLGRRRTLTEGTLSLYVAPGLGRLDALALPFRAILGRLRQHQKFEEWRATTITLQTSQRTLSVALDGEICQLETPLRFSVRPRALRAIVPADSVG